MSNLPLFISYPSLRLPITLRSALKEPFGTLIKPNKYSAEYLVAESRKNSNKIIITVGDVVTDTLIESGIQPDLSIIDGITLRGTYTSRRIDTTNFLQKNINNPPATISGEIWPVLEDVLTQIIENRVKSKKLSFLLKIKGEEDLLTIPCIMQAPLGSYVYYGQPGEGIVEICITNEIKRKIKILIEQFEVISE